MGYSIPAAIGAKLASEKSEVVAICGDGSFQMQMMELATICQNRIGVKIIIMQNNRLGMVRELQKKVYSDNLTAVFLDGSPDFIALANAYGIKGETLDSMKNAEQAVGRLISSKDSYVIVCNISPDEGTL